MLQSMAIKISNPFQQLRKIVRFSVSNSNLKTQKYVKSVRTQTLKSNKNLNLKIEENNAENK